MKKTGLSIFILLMTLSGPLFAGTGRVYFIRSASFSETVVSPAYTRLLKRSFRKAYADPRMTAVVLEIDTPGGRIDAALTIKDIILKYATEDKRPLVAYINTHAISAGALIALACPKIFMDPAGTIGDAAPVTQSKGKMVRLGEKVVSPIRAVFKGLGEKYGRPPDVLMAMVDSDIVLQRVRHGIAKKKGKLLTLTAKNALRLKVCEGIVHGKAALIKKIAPGGASTIHLDYTDTDKILIFLTSPLLSWLLMTLGIVGLIFEVKTPGWGVGGTIGLLCLAAFFTSRVMLNPGSWVAPLLFLIGAVLLLIELFVIPGFGLVGLGGIMLMIGSLLMALGVEDLRSSATVLAASMISSALLTALLFKLVPRTRTFRKIVLSSSSQGYKSPTDHDDIPELTEKKGVALTNLRPSGTISINGTRYDALSSGSYVKKGKKIEVCAIQGMRLVVKPVEKKSKT